MKGKLLFITAFTPSEVAAAEKNTKIMLNDLARQYEVDLVYFKYKNDTPYLPESHNVNVIKVVNNSTPKKLCSIALLPYLHPIFSVRYSVSLRKFLQSIINTNKYSAIILDHSQVMIYGRKLRFGGPKVMLSHDVEAQRFERTSNKFMTWICRKSEEYIFNAKNSYLSTFCQKDVDLIYKYYKKKAHLCLDYIDERIIHYTPDTIKDSYVMFGNWKRADNYEGAIWLLNQLDKLLKSPIKVNIIGKDFPMEQLTLETNKIEICNMGFMNNPYEEIAQSKAMLCPILTGAGIKVKVMESLASGTPVIGTELAFEGFSEKYRTFMLECKSQTDFATTIDKVNISLKERLAFKQMFIDDYTSDTIPEWIKHLS